MFGNYCSAIMSTLVVVCIPLVHIAKHRVLDRGGTWMMIFLLLTGYFLWYLGVMKEQAQNRERDGHQK